MEDQLKHGEHLLSIEDIMISYQRLKDVVQQTPLQKDERLSEKYSCNVYLKREDLQIVRSFKLRGALNFMKSLSADELKRGVVCASAGNHAQGVAFSCALLQTKGMIFMPSTTPRQKVAQVELHGRGYVEIVLTGDTFDESYKEAVKYCEEHSAVFVHPFDDVRVMAGQGTVAVEILNQCDTTLDYLFASVGGGGLISGIGTYMKTLSPTTKIIGVEPAGAASLFTSLKEGKVVELPSIDQLVDGAAVAKIDDKTFAVCSEVVDDIVVVPEGRVCTTILSLYNENAIVAEPAGALTVSALEDYKDKIVGKNIVCIISGGNNDIARMQEMKERSMIYEGLQHYFIVDFPQRAGALREFLVEVLGPTDDITRFEYTKNNNKAQGPALVGIELKHRKDYSALIQRMKDKGFTFKEVNKDEQLFQLLI